MSLFNIACHRCGTVVGVTGEDVYWMSQYKCPKCLTPMSTWAFAEMKHKQLSLALAARDQLSQIEPIYDANFITWEFDALPGEGEMATYWRAIAEGMEEEEQGGM